MTKARMFKIPGYQLYLLQLENYKLGRYWKLLFKKGLLPPKTGLRKELVWTLKAKLIFGFADLMIFGLSYFIISNSSLTLPAYWGGKLVGWLVLVLVFKFVSFIFFSLTALLIWPADWTAKRYIIYRAKSKIKKLSMNPDSGSGPGTAKLRLKIIGIAGSYGKTTLKQVLLAVLGAKFNTAATPESVNTPVGIGRWVLKKFDKDLEAAIVEMGEHYRGDIKELCRIMRPDIGVITGINEAHLERMGTLENSAAAIFEIAEEMKTGGKLFLNGDDKTVVEYSGKYRQSENTGRYQASNIKSQNFNAEALRWECETGELGRFHIYLLGEYALGDVDCAIQIAKSLGMNSEEIKRGIEKIKPVEHRLEPIRRSGNILVIDDAYNGNSAGVREAIRVLERFIGRRKIYITPGLVETGSAAREAHLGIGRQLAGAADAVILIKNSVTGWVAEGILSALPPDESQFAGTRLEGLKKSQAAGSCSRTAGRDKLRGTDSGESGNRDRAKPKIIWFNSAPEAHAALKDILKPGDVVLFQNDWGDQYI